VFLFLFSHFNFSSASLSFFSSFKKYIVEASPGVGDVF